MSTTAQGEHDGPIVSAHQPYLLAWFGYWQKMRAADKWVVCPLEEYRRRKHFNRVRIPPDLWLTIPVHDSGSHGQIIRDMRIDQSTGWWRKFAGRVRATYGLAAADELAAALGTTVFSQWLQDVVMASHNWLAGKLGVETPQWTDYALGLQMEGRDATDKIVDLCEATGCSRYLSGPTGPDYLDMPRLHAAGIQVLVQTYQPPNPFSAIDALWSNTDAMRKWREACSDPGYAVLEG